MANEMEHGTESTIARRGLLRRHAVLCLAVAAVLAGGALRFIPADSATAAGSGDDEVAAVTACAAT